MKLHWGLSIAIFYGLFVLVWVFVIFRSRSVDHSLVSDHYYADDLKYQEQYDKLLNTKAFEAQVLIEHAQGSANIEVTLPETFNEAKGKVLFFCPSDKTMDFSADLQLNEYGQQSFPVKGLKTGLWIVKVNWQLAGKGYYKEQAIHI